MLFAAMSWLSLTIAVAASPAPAPPSVEKLAWLAGVWSGADGPLETEEMWTAPKGGMILGMHRDVKAGKAVSFEFFRIAETAEGVFYFASPSGHPATPFKMIESGGRRAVFANPKHDFPQKIIYWMDEEDVLRARIEGPQNGKTVGEEWSWKRAK